MIGSNATLGPGARIGENSIVSIGAVVMGRVPDKKVVIGNPAKVVWDVNAKLVK
jgi:acetyltransferase-like isoleucine patch superfamily enzyme